MQTRKTEKPFELRDSRALRERWGVAPVRQSGHCSSLLSSSQRFHGNVLLRLLMPAYVHQIWLYLHFETSVCSGVQLFGCQP
jgi:hypothetical protein